MTTKTFDAVKLMRELRDQLSREMERMTPEERSRYIRDKAASSPLGRKIAESTSDAGRDEEASGRAPARR